MESTSYAPIPRDDRGNVLTQKDSHRRSPTSTFHSKSTSSSSALGAYTLVGLALVSLIYFVAKGLNATTPLLSPLPSPPSRSKTAEDLFYGILNRTAVEIYPPVPPLAVADEDYVAICVSVKGQVYDLPEWIRHHYYHLNIHNLYIMDDGTNPPLADQFSNIELGVPRSAVHFIRFTPETRRLPQQFNAYRTCIDMFGSRHPWFAFIDADEYLEMVEPGLSVQALLHPLESKAGALAVNWIMHDSNGLLTTPERGAARKSFTSCLVDPDENNYPIDNAHLKLIVQSKYYMGMITPHNSAYSGGMVALGEDGVPIGPPGYLRNPPVRNKIALHHYVVKSKEEYEEKVARGNGMDDPKAWDFWDYILSTPKTPCFSLADYTP